MFPAFCYRIRIRLSFALLSLPLLLFSVPLPAAPVVSSVMSGVLLSTSGSGMLVWVVGSMGGSVVGIVVGTVVGVVVTGTVVGTVVAGVVFCA